MVSVAYSDLQTVLNLTTNDISAANTETLIDWAIDLLNLYGNVSISNMSGVAGSKTVTLTSKQRGAVFFVARSIYYAGYMDPRPMSVGGESVLPIDLMMNPTFERMVKMAARQLTTFTITRTT